MAGFWDICVPSKSDYTNLVTNPSGETATTGYVAIGSATVGLSSDYSRRGSLSINVQTTSASADGVAYDALALTSGVTYQMGVDVYSIAPGVPYVCYFATTAGVPVSTQTTFTGDDDWQRQLVTYAATATANYRVYVTKNDNDDQNGFSIDGLSVVAASAEMTYFDGDSDGCYWTGTPHASTSVAPGTVRDYGSWVNLDDYGFYVQEIGSVGMPLVSNQVQSYAFKPGARFNSQKVLPRVFLVQGETIGSSRSDYHSKRKSLLDVIKPDYQGGNQEFVLRYKGANSTKPALIWARYDDGFGMGAIDGYAEKIAIRLLAVDPFWYEDGEGSASLIWGTGISNPDPTYAAKRIRDTWSTISENITGAVRDIAKGINNEIYLAGDFTNLGDANGDYIVSYNPTTGAFTSLGTGMNGAVHALAVAPNGYLYAGGAFTLAGGVANTVRIAYWDGAAWQALSTGIASGVVRALAFDHDGLLYVGGTFTNHVDANGDYITKWNGTAFASLGTGMNGNVLALAVDKDNNLYAAGEFGTAGGTTAAVIAKWNGTAWAAVGDGTVSASADGNTLAVDGRNNVYLGGEFTAIGGITATNVATWNGSSWHAMGNGIAEPVLSSAVSASGLVYFVCIISASPFFNYVWNGSTFSYLPYRPVFVTDINYYKVFVDGEDIYLGYDEASTAATIPSSNTLTNNGTAAVRPIIKIKATSGTAAIYYLKNVTTGAIIYSDYTIQEGETLTIDCQNQRAISTFFGDVTGRAILRQSELTGFTILPGSNTVQIRLSSSSTTTYATWDILHWSVDGVAA